MIQKDYVLHMARYNAWQNAQLRPILQGLDADMLTKDCGAFFGSVLATLNHILWADTMWMGRFCSDVNVVASGATHTEYSDTLGEWDAARFRMDGRIRIWAETLSNMDLRGELEWYSRTLDRSVIRPAGLCVVQMFNHQIHHRGQIHQMLSALGAETPATDIVFMPDDA